ncbi:MAG: hypothetical protein NTX61_10955 [Bacteroidetes bacterium]|nr:hypothetical protein [Bacteroidota bacterium]
MIHNTQRQIVNQWYIVTLVFLMSVFLPSILGINGMDGGYGISFLAGFMVMVGLIVIVVYRARAKQMDKILKGEGRIAEWHYTPEEWMRFVAADYLDEKKAKKNLYVMLVVIGLIVGIVMTVVLQSPVILIGVAGIFAITAIPAFLVPRMRFRKLRHSEAEALIAENGVIVGKMFHLWVKLGASLNKVSINSKEHPNIIEFAYSMPTRNGIQEEVARVPVPEGKMDEALRIVEHFNCGVMNF